MQTPEAALAGLVRDQRGIVTRSQALGAGVSRHAIDLRLSDGRISRLHDGVFIHAAVPLDQRGRLLAAVLAAGHDAVASHRSAAMLHSFAGVPRSRPELTVVGTAFPVLAGVHVHRTNLLHDFDRTVVDGIACTSRPRTLLDLGAVVPYEVVERTVGDAVVRKLVTREQLFAVLERAGGRGRRGTAALRATVRYALPDDKLESELEWRLSKLFPAGHGLVLQYRFTCVDGREVRFDAADPGRRIAIESNGHRWHATTAQLRRDMERRRSIKASGWDLYEYGWSDVVEAPEAVRAELARLLA